MAIYVLVYSFMYFKLISTYFIPNYDLPQVIHKLDNLPLGNQELTVFLIIYFHNTTINFSTDWMPAMESKSDQRSDTNIVQHTVDNTTATF